MPLIGRHNVSCCAQSLRILKMILMIVVASVAVHANAAEPRFESAYTDLSKDCRRAFDEDLEEAGEDMPLRCPGPSGASLYIYFSAIAAFMQVDTKDEQGMLAQPLQLGEYDRGKIEWRMTDGEPFAIIVRIRKSKGRRETLEVRGIGAYRTLSGSVGVAGNANANAKARALVDSARSARR